MLILDRKPGQGIVLGKNIVLAVERIDGDRVKLTIAAPDSVTIRRGEIKRREKTSAKDQ